MQNMKSLSCTLFLLILSVLIESHTRDCYYNESRNHVEYVCDGDVGKRFNQKTNEFLYCHNYYSGINRTNVESMGFRNCYILEMDTFNLWNFSGVRVLNISTFGFEYLPDFLFKGNSRLERITLSHNHLKELPAILFNSTPHLVEVDFSFNRITKINPMLFDTTHKLKAVNFSFNAIKMLDSSTFSRLQELKTLDLSSNKLKTIDSELFTHNKQLQILNLNNNNVKQLSCEFLASLMKNSLDIFINTLQEIQTNCFRDEKQFGLDVFISPKETTTHLQVTEGHFKWIFSELDFIKIHYINFLSNRMKNTIEIFQDAFTDDSIKPFDVFGYLLAFAILIVFVMCVIFVVRICKWSIETYIKSIVVFSVGQDFANDIQYQQTNIPSSC